MEVVECHRVIRLRILSAGNGTEASADSQQTPEHGGLLKRDPPAAEVGWPCLLCLHPWTGSALAHGSLPEQWCTGRSWGVWPGEVEVWGGSGVWDGGPSRGERGEA